tara:strand:+ start:35 stop:526 length:492 start_codon:yes stop_codon:yes gene_type:complete
MTEMTDPGDALALFQEAFEEGLIPLQPTQVDPDLQFARDRPNGRSRFNYMRAQGDTLTVLVMFAENGMVDGHPCFNIGYAVAEPYRGRGLAKSTLVAALAELTQGLGAAGFPRFMIEAVIGVDHAVSQSVARAVFDTVPTTMIDEVSGKPALHFEWEIETARR